MNNTNEVFWKRWLESGELERLNIISELPMFDKIKYESKHKVSVTLINSYFEDLSEYMKNISSKMG